MVKSYIDAHERNDLDGLMSLLRDDLRFAMLPEPGTLIMTAKDAVDGWVSVGSSSAATTTGAVSPRRSTACLPPRCTAAPPTTRSTGY